MLLVILNCIHEAGPILGVILESQRLPFTFTEHLTKKVTAMVFSEKAFDPKCSSVPIGEVRQKGR